MNIGAVLDGEEKACPLEFDLPTAFQPIDLHANAADRGADLYAKLEEAQLPLTEEERLWLLLTNQRLVEQMIQQGVAYAAMFLGRSDRGTTALTTAQFTVTVQRGIVGAGGTLEELATSLREHRADCVAERVQLPIGPGLAIIEDDGVEMYRDPFGEASEAIKQVRQLQVVVPLTGRRQLAYFGISTECIRDWDDYVTMMAEICKTIRWPAGSQNRISAVLDG